MVFPDDQVMTFLLAIATKQDIVPVDGVLTVHLPRGGVIEDVVEQLDALEERGWVEIQGEDDKSYPQLTEQGQYALERWLKKNFDLRVPAESIRLTRKLARVFKPKPRKGSHA